MVIQCNCINTKFYDYFQQKLESLFPITINYWQPGDQLSESLLVYKYCSQNKLPVPYYQDLHVHLVEKELK